MLKDDLRKKHFFERLNATTLFDSLNATNE